MGRRAVALTVAASAVLIAACGGSDDTADPVDTVAASVTSQAEPTGAAGATASSVETSDASTAATVDSTATTSPATASTDGALNGDLAGAIGVAMQVVMDRTVLPTPDPACFDDAVAAIDADTRAAADQLLADPFSWYRLRPPQRLPLASAYVECADLEGVLGFLALGTVNALDMTCVADAWRGVLTADQIAASLAAGRGLDDLPPDVVAQLAAGARPCLPPDPTWWIDDVALELDGQHDMSTEQAACAARHVVDTLGIDVVLERRILTVPMLTLPDTDLAALQLACGVTVTLPPMSAGVGGECLAEVFDDDEQPDVVACDQPHDGEILTTVDLSAEFPAWPGLLTIDERSRVACLDAANRAAADRPDIGVVWFVPTRQVWLRGGRITSCIIGPIDGDPWTSSSGITVPPTTMPAG